MTWRRTQQAGEVATLAITDVCEQISDPLILAPGHQLRGERCMLCGMLAGGRAMRLAVVVDTRLPLAQCGSIPAVTFLICSEHETGADLDITTPALQKCAAGHRKHAS